MANHEGPDFAGLFARELRHLTAEVEAYSAEEELWVTRGAQKNPPGTLVLHLCGNLLHYIGAGLGRSRYVRDRTSEFSARVTRAELLERLAECERTVTEVLSGLPDSAFDEIYPGEPPTRMSGIRTRPMLLHVLWHLGWHAGQLFYHRVGGESPGA